MYFLLKKKRAIKHCRGVTPRQEETCQLHDYQKMSDEQLSDLIAFEPCQILEP